MSMLFKRIKDWLLSATESDLVAGNYLALDGNSGTKKAPNDLFAKSSEVGKNVSVAGTLAATYNYHIVRVRGKVGDVVNLDYTASQKSNLVVVPEGGSVSILIHQAKSGHYDYVLTSSSADFGFYGEVGMEYTLSAKSGLKLDIDTVASNLSNFKKSNLKTTYSGKLLTVSSYDYKIAYVEGNVGDKVYVDYTASGSSNLVVVPEGKSFIILKHSVNSGSVEYTLTTKSATFGIYNDSGTELTYTLNVRAGLSSDMQQLKNEVENLHVNDKSNLKTTYSGKLLTASAYDYKIAYVEGNVGDKVYVDYTASGSSNLVVIPEGKSFIILKHSVNSGSVEYTLTTKSATFGIYNDSGTELTYTLNVRAGLSSEIRQYNDRIDGVENHIGSVKTYTGTLSSYNYNIATLKGKVGDKVYIGFSTSQDVNLVIGHTAVVSAKRYGWYEYTMTSNSIGVGFYVDASTDYTLEVRMGVEGRLQNVTDNVANFKTKKLLVLGDSISTSGYYFKYLKEEFSACKTIAVVSATWADRNSTDAYDGNPTQGVPKGNVMGNQVQKIKNTPSLVSFAPDVILLAAGTNDTDSTGATLNESLFTDSNGFVSLGTPTFDSADTYMANRKTMAGAMRYCITELEKIYPNAQIFICTPIQSAKNQHQYANTKNKQELQKAVGHRMSVNVIDVGGECGIYGDFEYQGSNWTEEEAGSHAGRDLCDGLHPNSSGSKKMASCILRALVSHYTRNDVV